MAWWRGTAAPNITTKNTGKKKCRHEKSIMVKNLRQAIWSSACGGTCRRGMINEFMKCGVQGVIIDLNEGEEIILTFLQTQNLK